MHIAKMALQSLQELQHYVISGVKRCAYHVNFYGAAMTGPALTMSICRSWLPAARFPVRAPFP